MSASARAAGSGAGAAPALRVSGVSRRFGGVQAVADVSLAVEPGTVFGIIGPNGAGKTTLVNMISGHERCDQGQIAFGDEELGGRPVPAVAALGVARTFQNIRLYRELSVIDNVVIGGHLHRPADAVRALVPTPATRRARRARTEHARSLLVLVGLDPDAVGKRAAGTLAYGDQRRVEVARALASEPRLLLLDEPAAGMNRVEKDRLRALLEELVAARGLTLVLIEHDVRLVMQLCQRLAVLNFGAKIAEGTPAEVAEDPAVVAAYLGTRVAEAVEAGETVEAAVQDAVVEVVAEAPPPARRPVRPAVLSVEDLEVTYGAIRAVQGVSFEVGEGELVALIGANGAGKSSILRALSGIVPARGRARFGALDLLSARSPRIVRAGLVQVPEGREILARLTVEENLELGAWARRDQRAVALDIDEYLQRFPVLGERRSLPAGQLSGGEQQILAIARALVARPRLLLLDEPSLGLAPQLADEVFGIVKAVNAEGISVLLVEQNAYQALELADRAWVIETGQVAISGHAADLLHDERVRASYLGME